MDFENIIFVAAGLVVGFLSFFVFFHDIDTTQSCPVVIDRIIERNISIPCKAPKTEILCVGHEDGWAKCRLEGYG